jgi:protein-disulfide reductase (glutathione)
LSPNAVGAAPAVDGERGGFNSKRIAYTPWALALDTAARERRPIMLTIHKSWCQACKLLRQQFVASPEIEALSEYYVMVSAEDDDEPADPAYAPHGSYTPRILFLNSTGEVLPVQNADLPDPQSPHFFGTAAEVIVAMATGLKLTLGIQHVDDLS